MMEPVLLEIFLYGKSRQIRKTTFRKDRRMYRLQPCRSCILIGISWIVFFPTGAAGQLLVGDRVSNQILEYNLDGTSTGFSISTPSTPPSTPPFTPSAMAFGSGSDLFVASENYGTIIRYNWLTREDCQNPIQTELNQIGGLLYDSASNTLYVSQYGNYEGNQIIKYNATTGAKIGVLDVGSTAIGLADMALGTDGSLYVSSYWEGQVYKGNSNTGNFSALSGISGMLYGASGLVLDSSDKLNIKLDVIGMWTHNVIQCNSDGTKVHELVPMPPLGGLDWPSDIVIDPDGDLLIASIGYDSPNGYIGKYDATTGTKIEPSPFITFSLSTQPSALLIEPALWTGSADIYWKNSANWRGTPPVYQGDIRFGAVKTGGYITNNNFDQWTQFNGITFISDADASSYTLQGNAIKLGGPVVNQSTNDQEIDLAMELVPGGGSFDTGGQKLTVGGLISGDGSLTKKGAGTLSLVGGVIYSGSTTVTSGTLDIVGPLTRSPTIDVDGAGSELLAQSIVADTLTIGAGATVVIKAIPGGVTAETDLKAVPEPGEMVLLVTAGALAPLVFLSRRRKT
jgi:autotransporter-associated beta strand protein